MKMTIFGQVFPKGSRQDSKDDQEGRDKENDHQNEGTSVDPASDSDPEDISVQSHAEAGDGNDVDFVPANQSKYSSDSDISIDGDEEKNPDDPSEQRKALKRSTRSSIPMTSSASMLMLRKPVVYHEQWPRYFGLVGRSFARTDHPIQLPAFRASAVAEAGVDLTHQHLPENETTDESKLRNHLDIGSSNHTDNLLLSYDDDPGMNLDVTAGVEFRQLNSISSCPMVDLCDQVASLHASNVTFENVESNSYGEKPDETASHFDYSSTEHEAPKVEVSNSAISDFRVDCNYNDVTVLSGTTECEKTAQPVIQQPFLESSKPEADDAADDVSDDAFDQNDDKDVVDLPCAVDYPLSSHSLLSNAADNETFGLSDADVNTKNLTGHNVDRYQADLSLITDKQTLPRFGDNDDDDDDFGSIGRFGERRDGHEFHASVRQSNGCLDGSFDDVDSKLEEEQTILMMSNFQSSPILVENSETHDFQPNSEDNGVNNHIARSESVEGRDQAVHRTHVSSTPTSFQTEQYQRSGDVHIEADQISKAFGGKSSETNCDNIGPQRNRDNLYDFNTEFTVQRSLFIGNDSDVSRLHYDVVQETSQLFDSGYYSGSNWSTMNGGALANSNDKIQFRNTATENRQQKFGGSIDMDKEVELNQFDELRGSPRGRDINRRDDDIVCDVIEENNSLELYSSACLPMSSDLISHLPQMPFDDVELFPTTQVMPSASSNDHLARFAAELDVGSDQNIIEFMTTDNGESRVIQSPVRTNGCYRFKMSSPVFDADMMTTGFSDQALLSEEPTSKRNATTTYMNTTVENKSLAAGEVVSIPQLSLADDLIRENETLNPISSQSPRVDVLVSGNSLETVETICSTTLSISPLTGGHDKWNETPTRYSYTSRPVHKLQNFAAVRSYKTTKNSPLASANRKNSRHNRFVSPAMTSAIRKPVDLLEGDDLWETEKFSIFRSVKMVPHDLSSRGNTTALATTSEVFRTGAGDEDDLLHNHIEFPEHSTIRSYEQLSPTNSAGSEPFTDFESTGDPLLDDNISLWRRLANERRHYADQLRTLLAVRRKQTHNLRLLDIEASTLRHHLQVLEMQNSAAVADYS